MVGTLRSDCAGCFVVYLAKKIVNFTKNQLFYQKIVEKICVYEKKCLYLCTVKQKQLTIKNYYNYETLSYY